MTEMRDCKNDDCQNYEDGACALDFVTLDDTGECEQQVSVDEATESAESKKP